MYQAIAPLTEEVKTTIAICFQFLSSPTFSVRSKTTLVLVSTLVSRALTVSNLPLILVNPVRISKVRSAIALVFASVDRAIDSVTFVRLSIDVLIS